MASQICVWDFTCPGEGTDREMLIAWLEEHTKKWAFQLERGETGYEHYQGRFSLKIKDRLIALKKYIFDERAHLSPTSTANRDNMFYVMKPDTRIDGPWSDENKPAYIPWDVQAVEGLRPWQAKVLAWSTQRELRRIRVIVDQGGNQGKTTLCRWMQVHGHGQIVPYCNDHKELMGMFMDIPQSNMYLVDMPRAIPKKNLGGMWAALETVKGGYAYDPRYRFRQKLFDPPQLVVFTNERPELWALSADRWEVYQIVKHDLEILGEATASVALQNLFDSATVKEFESPDQLDLSDLVII